MQKLCTTKRMNSTGTYYIKLLKICLLQFVYINKYHTTTYFFFPCRKPTVPVLEALISINNKLGQKEAAAGLLQWGHKNLEESLKGKEHWYEKLADWDKALELYKKQSIQNPKDPDLIFKKMRCLENLGEWGQVHDIANEHWESMAQDVKLKMAR